MNDFPNEVVMNDSDLTAISRVCELTRRIDILTHRQICDLRVVHDTDKVILSGRSRSYYVKQLASQAVIDLMPGVAVENSIDVLTNKS